MYLDRSAGLEAICLLWRTRCISSIFVYSVSILLVCPKEIAPDLLNHYFPIQQFFDCLFTLHLVKKLILIFWFFFGRWGVFA